MDKRNEQNEPHSNELQKSVEQPLYQETNDTETLNRLHEADQEDNEIEKLEHNKDNSISDSELEVDEGTDNQTDIYYQKEAVIAIERKTQETNNGEAQAKAGFWIRFWAYLIDAIIVFSLNGIVLAPVAFFRTAPIFDWQVISVIGILSGIVYYLYFLLMTKLFQQTLGKMVMGIKVISTTRDKLVWSDLFFREVIGRFMHNAFFVLKLLYIVVAFTDDKKGVHDIIGNTRVIHVS